MNYCKSLLYIYLGLYMYHGVLLRLCSWSRVAIYNIYSVVELDHGLGTYGQLFCSM